MIVAVGRAELGDEEHARLARRVLADLRLARAVGAGVAADVRVLDVDGREVHAVGAELCPAGPERRERDGEVAGRGVGRAPEQLRDEEVGVSARLAEDLHRRLGVAEDGSQKA